MPWTFNPFTGKLDQTADSGGGGSQVNSDWNATSGVEQILNLPTSFNPSAHASTHSTGGTDPIAATDIGAIPNNASTSFGGKYYSRTGLPTTATSPINTSGVWAFYKNTATSGSSAGDVRLYVNDGGSLKFLQFQSQPFAAIATSGSATDLITGVIPDARLSSNVVTLDGTQTITNKSISSGQITGLGTAATKDIPSSGNASTTQIVYGSDTRLTDSRTPTSHTHALSDLTQSSATTGQVVSWNGTAWAPATPASSTDASALNTGTLSDARLSSNVLLLTGSQTITGTKTITPAAGSSALIASNVTHTTSAPILDLTQTWNASAVAFSAIKLSVTNTASATASALLDLAVGGTSQLRVTPAKQIQLFNSRTDASNYECGVLDWTTNSNALTIGTQKAGTGTARRVRLNSAENIDYYISDSSRVFQMATNGNISFSPMTWQYYSGAGDPTTSTTPWNNGSGYCGLWRNTTTGVVKLWVNNAGTMVSVALS